MNILFVHQNFPGQYLHLARHLAAQPGNRVVALSQRQDGDLPGVRTIRYRPPRDVSKDTHHYLRGVEASVLNAQAVARVALNLKKSGFVPDILVGHNGWGEIWYLKDVFPKAPLLGYFEFFYRVSGADVGFDPAEALSFDSAPRLRTRNCGNLLGLEAADRGQCPTAWQKSTYPARYHPALDVVHDGVNTGLVRPDANAKLALPADPVTRPTALELRAGDEVVTYVARNLEPYRGFPSFMRSLPTILAARPDAHVLIVGGDEVSYGRHPADGQTWRQQLLDELGDALDLKRVHFLGKLPYADYLKVLQISRAHVYLTYPFVLSWSMLEAMAAGCLVIGSKTPPVEEVIEDGVNGWLVDFFKPGQIAARVIEALAAPAAFVDLRSRARQTIVDRYDLQRICLPRQMALLEQMG